MPEKDAPILEAIQSTMGLTNKGRDKVIHLVRKKHPELGSSRIRRVYEQNGFAFYKHKKSRSKNKPPNPITIPPALNEEWAIDFMSDALLDGRKIRTLNCVDHHNRQCNGIEIRFSFPARCVIDFLERAIAYYGKPKRIRTDNGPEFTSKQFQKWLFDNHIAWSEIEKGKPQQNAIIERLNKTIREDLLDAFLFHDIEDAQQKADAWIVDYNEIRPHEALNYETPLSYVV